MTFSFDIHIFHWFHLKTRCEGLTCVCVPVYISYGCVSRYECTYMSVLTRNYYSTKVQVFFTSHNVSSQGSVGKGIASHAKGKKEKNWIPISLLISLSPFSIFLAFGPVLFFSGLYICPSGYLPILSFYQIYYIYCVLLLRPFIAYHIRPCG